MREVRGGGADPALDYPRLPAMSAATKTPAWSGTGTASVVALRPVFAFARTRGVDVEAIARGLGMPASALDQYDLRIPEASRARAWVEVVEQAGDPAFGLHVAEQSTIGAYDVLDYALYFSTTLGDAIDHLVRFHRVLCDAWAMKQEVAGSVARLRRVERTSPDEGEAALALLVLRARQLTGLSLTPHEVRFSHAAPADTAPHAALLRCPVRFGCSTSEIVFDARDLALPVRTANPGVGGVLDRYMTELLGRLPKSTSFVDRVRGVVAEALRRGERPSIQATARALHASVRTVQRRLGEHGMSHTEVVDAVRRELAERLVADRRVSLTEVAFLTGFADVSGFRRMYKRWTGVTPSRSRQHA